MIDTQLEKQVVDYLRKSTRITSLTQVAQRFNLTRHSIRKIARKYEIEIKTQEEILYNNALNGVIGLVPRKTEEKARKPYQIRRDTTKPDKRCKEFTPEQERYLEMHGNRISLVDLSKYLGISRPVIARYLDSKGIRKIQKKTKEVV